MSFPVAYFITFHTYGTWLHGRAEGSVDYHRRKRGAPFVRPDERLVTARQRQMKADSVRLDESCRKVVLHSILETCQYRDWPLHAIHVRENHVHVVVSSQAAPEKVLRDLKAYATRHLRANGLIDAKSPVWSEHGSTRYLWDESRVVEKIQYTLYGQGRAMQRWPDKP